MRGQSVYSRRAQIDDHKDHMSEIRYYLSSTLVQSSVDDMAYICKVVRSKQEKLS